ncbi:hypothetical protein NEFER03_0531 [Nematocida sp. LUAm3]|nr:hypothetical protein NEFER03_0531 [Nematocida sp. LUAm3]KAI5175498.1 hypothetical protein NEFER02_1404 [Nematocida sp. LUAm2]KAI5178472.1 hypothetical protein NEFER01_1619 [Nematocida sp. LUAm1]
MSIEKKCLEMMQKEDESFEMYAQEYKIELMHEGRVTENTDSIFSYYLLSLLARGETRRFCLVRGGLERLTEMQEFPQVRSLDVLWRANLLGDFPQMKHSLQGLSTTHQKIGEVAINRLLGELQNKLEEKKEKETATIQQVIKMSELFFRV